jgi:hypothetical protein
MRVLGIIAALTAALLINACGESVETPLDSVEDVAVGDVAGDVTEDIGWTTNYEPGLTMRGDVRILHLKGTPYEMGRQHATFMKDELLDGVYFLENSELGLLEPLAEGLGFIAEAMTYSYPASKDECQGMADVAGEDGWTMNRCMALAYGEVVLDWVDSGMLACSQFAVAGPATKDGELLHGRNLDWDNIEYLLKYPTVIVRHSEGKIPYVVVGFPGNVAAYNGINAAGITVATNENGSTNDLDREGQPHAQMVNHILSSFTTMDEIITYITTANHMSSENMMVTSGKEGRAAIFEMTATHLYYEELGDDGLVYITNHFTVPEMTPWEDTKKEDASTYARYMRLEQLLTPEGKDTIYGQLDVPVAVSVLRDRYNPIKDEEYAADDFDNNDKGGAIAVNGAIYSIVFKPGDGMFWLASGDIPIPTNPYRGYILDELFGINPDAVTDPLVVE